MIIGITGKKQHGKDTIGKVLEEMGYTHVSFADPLRECVRVVFGVSYEEMLTTGVKETPLDRYPYESPRRILQRVGTDLFRNAYPDVWIEAFKRTCSGGNVYVTDVRFLNEAKIIKEMGGLVIRIVRPAKEDDGDLHPSEMEMEKIEADYTLVNPEGEEGISLARETLREIVSSI